MVNKPVQETGPTYTIHPLSLPLSPSPSEGSQYSALNHIHLFYRLNIVKLLTLKLLK